jgi:hypothetical protein
MNTPRSILRAQSFPSVDDRIAWIISLICLVIGLLLTLGVWTLPSFQLSGWTWLAIVCAQFLTAFAVAVAANYSSKKDSSGSDAIAPQETNQQ